MTRAFDDRSDGARAPEEPAWKTNEEAPAARLSPVERRSRREFLRDLLIAAGVGAGLISAACTPEERDAVLQKHYLKMTAEERREVAERLEREFLRRYEKPVRVDDTPAIPGTKFGYALDLSRCVGCRRCVYACGEENNLSRNPQVHWIRVMQLERARGLAIHHADAYYAPPTVPERKHFYLPVACQQCENPPCVRACPINATWQEPDGIVAIDYNWCIGCRYCMAACPYDARHFNWGHSSICAEGGDDCQVRIYHADRHDWKQAPAPVLNLDTHYLGNRPRDHGVVEKCTFCIQRVRHGRYPACVEACPAGAREFGDVNDPKSAISYVLQRSRIILLREELNTRPNFFYYFET
jgi:molybdopterin-containing oxidoreductase family iron-sulfur binding subunit